MSFEYYTTWWIHTKEKLAELNTVDEKFIKKAKPMKKRELASKAIGEFYVKYCLLVQEMDACLDQMAHPQKRQTIRKLMDAATIRLLEFSEELKKIDFSEYHYIDGNLVELKLIPYEMEIIHPAFFYPRPVDIEDMWQKILKNEQIFIRPEPEPEPEPEGEEGTETTEGAAAPEAPKDQTHPEAKQGPGTQAKSEGGGVVAEGGENPEGEEPPEGEGRAEKKEAKAKIVKKQPQQPRFLLEEKVLTEEEKLEIERQLVVAAKVNIIQTSERGRQARVYFFERYSYRQQRKRLAANKEPPEPPHPDVLDEAATKMQTLWRGYSARQWVKRKEEERRLLIGMNEPSWRSKEEFIKFENNLNKRREYRDQRIREYIQAIDNEKVRILRVVAPGLAEDIGDEIREWFHKFYNEIQMFDKYPPAALGGTVLVARCETMTPKEYLADCEKKRKEKEKNKGKEKEMKAKAKAEKKKKALEAKKKKLQEKKRLAAEAAMKKKKKLSDYEFEYIETVSKPIYQEGTLQHKEIWDLRNDFDNPLEKHYMDIITEKECYDNQLAVRLQVDELMVLELELLQEAVEKDKAKAKGKKYKPKKKKKPKKPKKGKKGKKDPTANRTTEDLFQELVDSGIIRNYPMVRLRDYKGDFSYKNWDLRKMKYNPSPTLLDVRQAVVMNCIMPLGVEVMKRPKSVLIAGPRQSGKHLLANAIFNETKSVLFDLSPEVTAGKYMGAKGMKMLIHLITKMSRLLAPSIIYFSAAEKIFYKKVPKDEKQLDPKRMGKKLYKGIVKTITPADRILVLGITGQPWAAQAAKMKKAFERNILIPRPDYGSLYLYWRELLMLYHGIDRNFNVTSLVTVTLNYPFPVIKEVLQQILTPRRIIQLRYKPLRAEEVYEVFVSNEIEPITDKEYKKFEKWYYKTPLGKQRNVFNKFEEIEREIEKKAKEKAEQNKKK